MLMKVFPHGTGAGDKPIRYLVRPDYPGRDTAPPQVLRGNPAMTRAYQQYRSALEVHLAKTCQAKICCVCAIRLDVCGLPWP